VISLVNGAWAVYIQFYGLAVPSGVGISGPQIWVAVVGGLLVIDSLISFAGVRLSFVFGAAISAVLLARLALAWLSYATGDGEAAAVLSVICIVLDAVAFRPSRGLAEKDSPLNLPVFG
jgi:hypothetical protein